MAQSGGTSDLQNHINRYPTWCLQSLHCWIQTPLLQCPNTIGKRNSITIWNGRQVWCLVSITLFDCHHEVLRMPHTLTKLCSTNSRKSIQQMMIRNRIQYCVQHSKHCLRVCESRRDLRQWNYTFANILLSLHNPDLCQLKVVVHEWNCNLNSEYEYRGFVHEGRLNALSRYNGYLNWVVQL